MKVAYKDLTDENIEYISSIYRLEITHNEKIDILTRRFGVKPRTMRSWWEKLSLQKKDSSLTKQLTAARERVLPTNTDIVLVSACQNKTVVNEAMLENMEAYADYIRSTYKKNVSIVIIPARYRNPTSLIEAKKKKAQNWWDGIVDKYLYYSIVNLGDTVIRADARINPTASSPLNGYQSLSAENNVVLGHPRIHTETLSRFKNAKLRVMTTTGFISRKNYSDSKAGLIGDIHHSYGFVVIEKDKDGLCLPPRAVKCKSDGSFIDINKEVIDGKVSKIKSIETFVLGDIHHRELNKDFLDASLDIIKDIEVENTIVHDCLDASSFNHHEKDDLFIRKLKIKQGLHLIKEEIDESLTFLEDLRERTDSQIKVVQSNHDDFLDRLINKSDWRNDLHNSEAHLEYAMIQQREDLITHGNIYGFLVNTETSKDVEYLRNQDSFNSMGYECGHHGDHGTNGSRGSINQFKKLNMKMVHGHQHSPKMKDGVTCVGVSCNIWQYYNSNGLSSWAYAHSPIFKNGKNQLWIFTDDYRLSTIL